MGGDMTALGQPIGPEQEALYEQLARKALVTFGLESADLLCLSSRQNVVFRVQTERGRWAIRICPPEQDRKALMRELLWLVALNLDTDLGVPEPVLTPTGELYQTVSMRGLSGFHAFSLFRWVKGQFADTITGDHLRALGRLTATLHRHAQTFDWPEEYAADRWWLGGLEERIRSLRRAFREPGERVETVLRALPLVHKSLSTLGHGRDAVGPVHGDLDFHHVLFHEGSARAIDFKTVHWNYYGLDIAASLRSIRLQSEAGELLRAYAEGYTGVRPLPCDLDAHLPTLEALHAMLQLDRVLAAPAARSEEMQDALQWAAGRAGGLLSAK